MSDLSIKVNIAGRVYPLTINREEEESVRLAAKRIEDSIKVFQQNYAVKDKQDLLAMTALQLATVKEKPIEQVNNNQEEISSALLDVVAELDKHLS
ncbi:MAG: cell division protein ZapA (FtsZ GTPase activity inhibitor) [Flavobacteriales bacterium]|jgi:cell division protein ZapA (FtsZ GTPase activity inhibitor)